jgi:carbonic anhydrase
METHYQHASSGQRQEYEMKKLIRGIIDFRKNRHEDYAPTFAKLALGQNPDALFIGCSDSRVQPNIFASTDPGDLFVLRNVGNIVPPCCSTSGLSQTDVSGFAAIEYAVNVLKVDDIIVCGHSECGAMRAGHNAFVLNEDPIQGQSGNNIDHLKSWLNHVRPAASSFRNGLRIDGTRPDHDELCLINILKQMENIKSYPTIQEKLDQGLLKIHGWFFDIKAAEVFAYQDDINKFVRIDEQHQAWYNNRWKK